MMERLTDAGIAPARFGVRRAEIADADAIGRVLVESWQSSYRGLLPDDVLATLDPAAKAASRRALLRIGQTLELVAYDATHGDLVGFCSAGPARKRPVHVAELYEIYLLDRAKRHGVGRELLESVMEACRRGGWTALIVWVLDSNLHARRFYEALGGRAAGRVDTVVRGAPVVERAYLWDPL